MRRQPSYQPARHDDAPATAHLHSQRLKVGHVGLSQTSQSGMAMKTRGNIRPRGNHNAPFTEAGYGCNRYHVITLKTPLHGAGSIYGNPGGYAKLREVGSIADVKGRAPHEDRE